MSDEGHGNPHLLLPEAGNAVLSAAGERPGERLYAPAAAVPGGRVVPAPPRPGGAGWERVSLVDGHAGIGPGTHATATAQWDHPVATLASLWEVSEARKRAGYEPGLRRQALEAGGERGVGAMIRILVVDDHTVVRQGLRSIVAEEPDMEVGGEAATAAELLRRVREGEWDVVVLDISLPDRSGLEVLREVKELRPEMPVLILSMHPGGQYAARAMREGAAGYVGKESAASEMVRAIRKVVGGGTYFSPYLAAGPCGDEVSQEGGGGGK